MVCCLSDNFITSAARITCKSTPNSTGCNYLLDVREHKIVIRHLFKEVRNCKLVVAIPDLPSDDIDNSQIE